MNREELPMQNAHPWHGISPGDNVPEIVNAIIEIPQKTRAKYELDKETGILRMDRVLYSSVFYPANYGFIPQTYCDDEDPLDIVVLSSISCVPLCMVSAKVIGVLRMEDGGEVDDKIIAVAEQDKSVSHYSELHDLPQHFFEELQNFFEDYKKLEKNKKAVEIDGFLPRKTALKIIEQSIVDYKKKFNIK